MKRFIILSFFVCIAAGAAMMAQQPPCFPEYHGLTIEAPFLETCPPYSVSMPYDVLIAYVAMDSLFNYADRNEFIDFMERQTYNDTLRTMMRCFYKVVDYDPVKYYQYLMDDRADTKIITTDGVWELIKSVRKNSPNPMLDETLIRSHIIAHIRVTDTVRRITPSAAVMKTAFIVTCEVLDTIKGQAMPSCKDVSLIPEDKIEESGGNGEILSFPSPCLQFECRLEWAPGGQTGFKAGTGPYYMVDENGGPWIKKGKEYIVFLKTVFICNTDSTMHLTLLPLVANKSMSFSTYPVENGYVTDPYDEFGFGTDVIVEEFKDLLRSRIESIITYEP